MVRWTLENPVVTKDLRGRMRGARAYWLLFGYLLLLSLALFFAYLAWWEEQQRGGFTGGASSFTVGRSFFQVIFGTQAVLIALITPALTAGAISIEREQRTFEMLRATTLTARSLVFGKLLSSASFIVLLLTSSLPLVSLCFLLGGVSPGEVFFAFLLLVCDAFLFGAIGLAWSAFAANTATATALSYGSIFVFFFGTLPLTALAYAGGPISGWGLGALNPVGAILNTLTLEHYFGWTWPAWFPAVVLNGSLGLLLLLACINRLEDEPALRALPLRLMTIAFCLLALFFADGATLATGRFLLPGNQLSMVTCFALIALLLFVPVLTTGNPAEEPRRKAGQSRLSAWDPRRFMTQATLATGLPLALLLVGLVCLLTTCALYLGHSHSVSSMRFSMPRPSSVLSGPVLAGLGEAFLLMVAVAAGIAGLGALLSVAARNRWLALTLLAVIVLLMVITPTFSYGYEPALSARTPLVNLLYFCPFLGLFQIGNTLDAAPGGLSQIVPATRGLALYHSVPVWIVTGILYLALGAVGWALAAVITKRPAKTA